MSHQGNHRRALYISASDTGRTLHNGGHELQLRCFWTRLETRLEERLETRLKTRLEETRVETRLETRPETRLEMRLETGL